MNPSATAQAAALLRAAHQVLDTPLILDDPIAVRIIGAENASALRRDPRRFQTPERRSLRAFIATRSRYAEDELAQAIDRGARQYVILGAGLDTFAYRNPHPESVLHVFEVDHPATQRWKQARLGETGVSAPGSLTFVPVDFERESLGTALDRAGFRTDEITFVSWLGVTVYLRNESVMKTLGFVASSTPPGSEIVFSFVVSRSSSIASRTAAMGEPWLTAFDPLLLEQELRRLGFRHVEHFGPAEATRRYLRDRDDGLSLGTLGHLMKARV